MCGIAGIWGKGDINPMIDVLEHRGPDDQGIFVDPVKPLKLGMKRLAVIDIEGGHQPIGNEDGSVNLIFNGMIYNYKELRSSLSKKHVFRTKSDTETIVHAFEEYGDSFPNHLNGMFAIALWDGKRLILVRDRMGEKPLYWYHDSERFLFASEIKSILTQVDAAPAIDDLFFSLETTVMDSTLFKGVKTLPPAHMLIFDGSKVEIKRYWDLRSDEPDPGKSDSFYINELRDLLEDAVRIRMRSDVEVGLFLSGGLDSALIACLARPEKVFSCNFPLGDAYDELEYAVEVTKKFNCEMYVVKPGPADFKDMMEDIVWHLDQPIATPSSIAEFMLARKAKEEVKVVLGGQGADEAFAGYIRYLFMHIEEQLSNIPQLLNYRPMARHFWGSDIFTDPVRRYAMLLHRGDGEPPDRLFDLVGNAFSKGRSLVDMMGLCDIDLTLPSLLTMNDRAAASVGLENRCPFLDHRILEFAFKLPVHLKMNGNTGKYILRQVAKGIVPDSIIERNDKKGLVIPLSHWLDGELKEWADAKIAKIGSAGARNALEKPSRGEFDRTRYNLLFLSIWRDKFAPGWEPDAG